jgi:hypothetical protein
MIVPAPDSGGNAQLVKDRHRRQVFGPDPVPGDGRTRRRELPLSDDRSPHPPDRQGVVVTIRVHRMISFLIGVSPWGLARGETDG